MHDEGWRSVGDLESQVGKMTDIVSARNIAAKGRVDEQIAHEFHRSLLLRVSNSPGV